VVALAAHPPLGYVGLITRAIALVIDAAVINGVAIAVDVDYMARTVVIEAPHLSVADVKRAQFRAAHARSPIASDGRGGEPPREVRSSDSGDDRDSARMQA
jgi:hypothetical protein